jgi:Protein phosphatase 2C
MVAVVCVQFSQHPTNGSTVGFFGVFDGAKLQHTALHRAAMPALCSLVVSPGEIASLELLSDGSHLNSTVPAVQAMAGRALRHMCRRTCGKRCRATTNLMQTSSRPWVRSLPCGNGGSTGARCAVATLAPLHVKWPSGLSPIAWRCMSASMAPVVTRAPFRSAACIVTAWLRPAVEAFVETDKAYLADEANSKKDDGCTAVAAVLLEDRLIVANVGDSRAVLSRGGKGAPAPPKPSSPTRRASCSSASCCRRSPCC